MEAETMKGNIQKCSWRQQKENFLQSLQDIQLSNRRLSDYGWIFKRLEKFMQSRSETEYCIGVGEAFKKEMQGTLGIHSLKVIATVIQRLDDFLTDGRYTLHASKRKPELPTHYQEHLDGYIEFCKLHSLRESTIARNVDYCRKTLLLFWEWNIRELSDITSRDVHNAFIASKSKTNFQASLRIFFKYLYKSGKHIINLSLSVPSIRKPQALPSTYTKEEMEKLLSSVDKTTGTGKRDYLIMLLAQKLGMRSGDIANLKYEDINRHTKTIHFIQEKTLAPHRLELLPEIDEALQEHLKTGGHDSSSGPIFLRAVPPYIGITRAVVSNVIRKAFKISGICVDGKKHGPHSLRMTLASELVAENTPYMVVSKILGHENPSAAKHYVKFDIEMLRACALDVPLLSGRIAEKLGSHEGGRS
jgi:integrase